MLTGAPLPIGILNRSYDSIAMAELRVESGHADIAQIDFLTDGIGFTAKSAGKYLAIWSSETLRQELSVAVSSPVSAAIARNENAWKQRSFDQLMSVSYVATGSGGSSRWDVSSHSKQTRTFMPFEHVSHSWLCDLGTGESSTLDLTIADPTYIKWMLAVMRIPGPTQEQRNTNIITGQSGSPSPSTDVTITSVTNYGNNGIWQISSTSSGGSVDFLFSVPRTGIAYTARFRLYPFSGTPASVSGSITVAISKRLGGSTTTITTGTMTIPLAGVQDLSLSIGSTVFTGSEFLGLLITGIDTGEKFQMEFSFDAA